ncbi:SpaH/EbpB family LPXTG-anchored major pilin [Macrococcus epidermidis]|uniref:SpaH/EbpB family LPXTG-anchored major pilin n=1 Tax=Macrococcus epidermidis TaxID=1902580 RepID=UPI0020B8035D|nr:SpaH/EbpB family LPXTG-anchored major pilin [Macrococcus epidermidis]UTH15996.1 SpaH/EbpB family LPXTG-anchored major pilin [Macrococcus epidermidis]
MSKLAKQFFVLFAITLLINVIAPSNNAHAAGPDTNLSIHKITGNTEQEATYDELTGKVTPSGDAISGISFTYWKITSAQLATMKANMSLYDTEAEVQAYIGAKMGQTAKTDANGVVTVPNLEEGIYWFTEDTSSSVITANAVPFGLELPVTNQAGTGYITDLHVYPKNTLEGSPLIDKDVSVDGNKSSSYDIGDDFNWLIQPTIVKGIEEYNKYTVTDKLDPALDFQGVDKVTVNVNGQALTPSSDYTVNYDEATRIVSVDFTSAGLKTLATFGVESKLNIMMPTVINNKAIMGKPILNNATLDFDNGHGTTTDPSGVGKIVAAARVAALDIPKVYTGGKNFIKTNGIDPLQGAEFVIQNKAGQYLQQEAATLRNVWVSDQAQATVFKSGDDGKFEVKGLAYGENGNNNGGSTDYILVETKAPSGYTIPTNPNYSFIVNSNSYYADPSIITDESSVATVSPKEIVNKKTSIPNTGGMGTVLFTVIGLGLMVLALITYRKRQKA